MNLRDAAGNRPRLKEKSSLARSTMGFHEESCRGDRTAIELFLVGVRGWEACLLRPLAAEEAWDE
jgi:hypothetical protein